MLHAELREPPAGVQDERDDDGAHAIEDGGHPRETAEVDIERAKRGHYDEVGQDEGPAAGPCTPEAATHISGEDTNLNGKRPRQDWLTAIASLISDLLSQPFSVTSSFSISPHS